MKIAVIPIDNRPICYDLIKDILAIDNNIELFMPNIEHLGGLQTQSNIDEIYDFLKNLSDIDYLITSLDTVAYGGLVSSRRCSDDFETIKNISEKPMIVEAIAASAIIQLVTNIMMSEPKNKTIAPTMLDTLE